MAGHTESHWPKINTNFDSFNTKPLLIHPNYQSTLWFIGCVHTIPVYSNSLEPFYIKVNDDWQQEGQKQAALEKTHQLLKVLNFSAGKT